MSEDLKAELEKLKAENAALKSNKTPRGTLSMKVSEKERYQSMGWADFP